MRVAIVTAHSDPSAGGGHTFEASLLASLCSHGGSHDYLICDTEGRVVEVVSCQSGFSEQSIQPPLPAFPRAGDVNPDGSPALLPFIAPPPPGHPNPELLLKRMSPVGLAASRHADFLWFPSPFCFDTQLPFVITVWDLEHRNQPFFPEISTSGWTWDERESFYRRVLPRASAVIVGTEVGKQEVVRYYGVNPANILVNPFPVPPGFPDRQPSGLCLGDSADSAIRNLQGCDYLLYPAQFWPHKNHANLLLALAMLRDVHGLMPALVLTGSDKGNQSYIERLIRNLNLDAQVQLLGFVERLDLSRLYTHASALVFPSMFGPDNLPPLEAFAHGCPVLASEGDGPREQLGDAAMLFDPANPSDIAACMLSVLRDDRLRQDLIANGHSRCQGRTVVNYLKRMTDYFDRFEAVRCTWPAGYVHS